jgi:hypothetical protein
VVNETLVKVLTTKVGVTSGSQDLKDAVLDGKERDIESTTTKVKHKDWRGKKRVSTKLKNPISSKD